MELTGSTADRWEQISNRINELATGISTKQELIKGILSTIEDLNTELDAERKALEQLGNLALKEVLREESGTLNDEMPVFNDEPDTKKQFKKEDSTNTDKSPKKQKKTDEANTQSPVIDAKQTELFNNPKG